MVGTEVRNSIEGSRVTFLILKSFPQNSVDNFVEIQKAGIAKLLQKWTYSILHRRAAGFGFRVSGFGFR